jgi:hypothetical protein
VHELKKCEHLKVTENTLKTLFAKAKSMFLSVADTVRKHVNPIGDPVPSFA